MHKFILSLIPLFFVFQSQAQTYKKVKKVVPIYNDLTYELGNLNNSRTAVKVKLPANTVSWCYAFEVNKGEVNKLSINLVSQLTRLIDNTGATAEIAYNVLSESLKGSQRCHVYLLDEEDKGRFMKKSDYFSFKGFDYYEKHQNISKGVFNVDKKNQDYYICFANPNKLNPINVTLSVVAVVKETVLIKLTSNQKKAITYGNLGWTSYKNDDLEKAIKYSHKSLGLDKNQGSVKANLGLFYLIKNKQKKATKYYIDAILDFKNKKKSTKSSLKTAINNIEEAHKKYPKIKGFEVIRDLLRHEYNQK